MKQVVEEIIGFGRDDLHTSQACSSTLTLSILLALLRQCRQPQAVEVQLSPSAAFTLKRLCLQALIKRTRKQTDAERSGGYPLQSGEPESGADGMVMGSRGSGSYCRGLFWKARPLAMPGSYTYRTCKQQAELRVAPSFHQAPVTTLLNCFASFPHMLQC